MVFKDNCVLRSHLRAAVLSVGKERKQQVAPFLLVAIQVAGIVVADMRSWLSVPDEG